MDKNRFRYSKTGKAIYISHLDLMAVMQRSLIRAEVNLKYSEGFNPHPYMSVALPLSIGTESLCELMDVRVADAELPDINLLKLPDGIKILEIYFPERKFSEISWIEVSGILYYDKKADADILLSLKERFAQKSIVIPKRTKRGYKDLDIAPYIKNVDFRFGKNIEITAMISAQNPTLNTEDLVNALDNAAKPVYSEMKRIAVYDSNMVIFR